MLNEEYKYINSNGEVLDFKKNGISINESSLRDYEWNYSSSNGKINQFFKEIQSFRLELTVNLRGFKDYSKVKDSIIEKFEIDILNNKPGVLKINNYYLKCFIIGNKKKDYLIADRYLKMELTVLCEEKIWVKETKFNLNASKVLRDDTPIKMYPYQYIYTYANKKNNVYIINESFGNSDIIIRIFGPASNPFVKIGDIVYQVNTYIEKNEYFEINTSNRTLVKVNNFGYKTNAFMYRSKDRADFFLKIPPGTQMASWGGYYNVEIVVIEKRSEPRW